MKLFTSTQIKEWDKYTIEHEPIKSIDLMERAAHAICSEICARWEPMRVVVFAGPGNNGGDALAVARLLAEHHFKTEVFLFNIHNRLSADCEANKARLLAAYPKATAATAVTTPGDATTAASSDAMTFTEVTVNFDPPLLGADTLVIDGLFGAGIDKPLTGGFASLAKYINQSDATVVSIDLPSGLMPDDNTFNIRTNIVKASLTLTFQQPKIAMFLADNQPYLGEVKVLDIGLAAQFARDTESHHLLLEESDVRALVRRRHTFAHKGEMGHALLTVGCYGMAGAAILSARACLRSGVGKVSVHTPRANNMALQIAVPEAIVVADSNETRIADVADSNRYQALGVGPGLGTDEPTALAIISQLRRTSCPVVIDADALNILASHRAWLQQVPKNSILTPHPKEMERLVNASNNGDAELLNQACEMAEHYHFYILLKGHHTALCLPSGKVVFNSTGNAGMATAGSGDVLTGIITALLARGYAQQQACMVGMYIHGLAGDMAARDKGMESLVASDIIDHLPEAFKFLTE